MRILNPSALGGGGGSGGVTTEAFVSITGGGTPAISKSTNVSSITDHAQGDFSVNFTDDLSSDDYFVAGICQQAAANNIGFDITIRAGTKNVTSCRFFFSTGSATLNDPSTISFFFGDA